MSKFDVIRSTIMAIKASIAHWSRMIVWARKQPVGDRPVRDRMEAELGEGWSSMHCALCKERRVYGKLDCFRCCLGPECCCPEWDVVNDCSMSWGAWAAHAELMVKRLQRELRAARRRRKQRRK